MNIKKTNPKIQAAAQELTDVSNRLINLITEDQKLSKYQKLTLFEQLKLFRIRSSYIEEVEDELHEQYDGASRHATILFTDMADQLDDDRKDEFINRCYEYALKYKYIGFVYDW